MSEKSEPKWPDEVKTRQAMSPTHQTFNICRQRCIAAFYEWYAGQQETCEWRLSADGSLYTTGCGHELYYDSYDENYAGCPYCLKRIEVKDE